MLPVRLPIPRFITAGEVFSGKGAIGVMRVLPAARSVVLVSSSILDDPAMSEKIHKSIRSQETLVVKAPKGEPVLDNLRDIISEISEFGPDWIIAIGGGSVIDAAKICWTFYEHPDLDLERATRPFGLPALRGRAKFVAMPTTSGSGSEVSSAATFTTAKRTSKSIMVSHDLLPDIVVLDPDLTRGVPARTAAAAGLDALAHAIESFVSVFNNPLVDLLAEQATRTILNDLPRSIGAPDDDGTRLRVMNAAMLAGTVQNLKVPGVGHAIAHQLSEFAVSHGEATGLMLAPAIRFNARDSEVRAKFDRLGESVGVAETDGLIGAITDLRHTLGLTNPLGDLAPDAIDQLTVSALEDPCARANPIPLDADAVRQVLEDALCEA